MENKTRMFETETGVIKQELLEHVTFFPMEILETDSKTGRPTKVRGTVGRAGIINENDRMYSMEVYTKATERAQKKIKDKKLLGEVDHPAYGSKPSLKRAAVLYTKLFMEGEYMQFEAKILSNPNGDLLASLLLDGVGVGVSTRGWGSYRWEDINGRMVQIVGTDYDIAGIDFVANESNRYGKVEHFESKEGLTMFKTVEELRKACPELVAQIEEDVKKQLEESIKKTVTEKIEKQFAEQKETAVKEAVEKAKKEFNESEELKTKLNVLESVLSALKPLIPEKLEESEAQKQIKALTEQTRTLTEEKNAIQKKLDALNEQIKAEAAKKEVVAYIEEKCKTDKFGSILKDKLMECKTKEDVDTKFKELKELLESAGLTPEALPGKGYANDENTQEDKKSEFNEAMERQRKLAGITETK